MKILIEKRNQFTLIMNQSPESRTDRPHLTWVIFLGSSHEGEKSCKNKTQQLISIFYTRLDGDAVDKTSCCCF